MSDRVETFFRQVSACALCHGADGILVPSRGRTWARGQAPRILVLGEQADRAACPGHKGPEDPAVERLRAFVAQTGIDEADVFFATAVMCVPRDPAMRGARPSAREIRNCTAHVQRLLGLLHPRVIVPVGYTPIQSIQWIYRDWKELRQFILSYDVGKVLERNELTVYPLYHTSTATLGARSQARQEKDWRQLASIVETLGSRA